MERKEVVGNVFNLIFVFWCVSDIILRTALEDIINQFLGEMIGIQDADIDKYIDVLVLVVLVTIIVFLQGYTQRELFLVAIVTIPILVATVNSNNNYLISMLLFVVGAKHANMEKIIRMYFYILIISIPIIILLCFTGILPDFTIYRNGQIRHAWGFEHPNRLGMRVFQLIACLCYVDKDNNHRWLKYACFASAAWFVYTIPNSQTAFIGILLLAILIAIGSVCDRHNISKKRIMTMLAYVAAIVNIVTVIASFFNPKDNALYNRIDRFLSHRFLFGYRMYKYYGVSIFGQNVQTVVKDSKYVGVYRQWYLDNAYFSILLRFGIIVYVIFSILWVAAIVYYVRRDNYTMVVILFTYSIYGIMTTGFYMMSHNIFLLTIANPMYQKEMTQKYEPRRKIRFVWEPYGRHTTKLGL